MDCGERWDKETEVRDEEVRGEGAPDPESTASTPVLLGAGLGCSALCCAFWCCRWALGEEEDVVR